MNLNLLLLLFLSLKLPCDSQLLNLTTLDSENEADSTLPCVLKLLERYFISEKAMKGSLAIVGLTKDPSMLEQAVVKILNEDNRHKMGVMVKDATKYHFSPAHVTEKASNYLILISNSSELSGTLKLFNRLPTWNTLANIAVFFTSDMNDTQLEIETQEVLNQIFSRSAYNVYVMSYRSEGRTIQSFTYFPYEADNCATSVKNIRLIDSCSTHKDEKGENQAKIKTYHAYLFPKIPRRFHGCRLNVSVFLQAPYADLDDNGQVKKGLEVMMLQQIAQELNFKLSYTFIDTNLVNSYITANATHGLYSNVLRGTSDLMVGGFYENAVSRKLLSSSIPYYQDELTWCVPPAKLASSLTNAFGIFNIFIWIIVIATLIVSGLILLRFARFERHNGSENVSWSMMTSLAFTLSQAAHFFPERAPVKIFLALLMFYGFHLNTAYHSFLITVMTKPKFEPQVSDVWTAVHNHYNFYGNEETLAYFVRKGNDSVSRAIVHRYHVCKDLDTCLAQIKTTEKIAVAISRHHSSNSPTISDSEMFCFNREENIYTYSVSMLAKKQYHLLEKINYLLRTISESGLLLRWAQQSESNNVQSENNAPSGGHGGGPVVKLKLEHVQGGFLLLTIGLVLALISFIGEHLFYHLSKRLILNTKWQGIIQQIDAMFC